MVDKIKNKIDNGQNLFWSLAVAIALCAGLYVYFSFHTVYSAVLRGQAEKSIQNMNSAADELESKYIALKSGITADLAASKGFTAIASAEFISRGTSGKGLSLNAGL